MGPIVADLTVNAEAALTGESAPHLTGLAADLTNAPGTTTTLADRVRQGSDAARFYGSGVHETGYATGVQQVRDWFISEIDSNR
ncbi:hypothetical protein ACWDYH_39370 [Nocardia goodfellowii]